MMKRAIHKSSLAALICVLAVTATALWFAWNTYAGASNVEWVGARYPHATTSFGEVALVILVVASPFIVWLTRKAFFEHFKR